MAPPRLLRRGFLAGSAALAGGCALAACGGGLATGLTTADRRLIVVAAAVEQMVVNLYASAMGSSALQAKVGPAPASLTTFWKAASSNHTAHIEAWTNLLGPTSQTNSVAADAVMTPAFEARLAGVARLPDLIALCVDLENVAAGTAQVAAGQLPAGEPAMTAASIAPVELQQAATLYFLLGFFPGVQGATGPQPFSPTNTGRPASDLTQKPPAG